MKQQGRVVHEDNCPPTSQAFSFSQLTEYNEPALKQATIAAHIISADFQTLVCP
jgi:hypothetical protein